MRKIKENIILTLTIAVFLGVVVYIFFKYKCSRIFKKAEDFCKENNVCDAEWSRND